MFGVSLVLTLRDDRIFHSHPGRVQTGGNAWLNAGREECSRKVADKWEDGTLRFYYDFTTPIPDSVFNADEARHDGVNRKGN